MNFFIDLEKLKKELKKSEGKKVALTTGCFDVLHQAHEDYLKDAKSRGDVLVVLLQSDKLVSERKGTVEKPRPIFSAEERARQLFNTSGYSGVIDYILVVESADDIYKSITEIHPDVLILSEATENDETNPERMRAHFEDQMKVNILPPKSTLHSSDIIDEKGIRSTLRIIKEIPKMR